VVAQVVRVEQPVLVQQQVEHRAGQRAVAAGLDRHPLVRLLGGGAHEGIDDHHLHATHARVGHVLGHAGERVVGAETRLAAEQQQMVAVGHVRVGGDRGVQGARQDVLGVAAVVAIGHEGGGRPEGGKERAERVHQRRQRNDGAAEEEPAWILLLHLLEARRDLVEGLIPAYFLPAGIDADALLRVGPAQRPVHAVRVVEQLDAGQTACTQAPAPDGIVRVALDLHEGAVSAVAANPALVVTHAAGARDPDVLYFACGVRSGLRHDGLSGVSPPSSV
jgi:hypothetical protein